MKVFKIGSVSYLRYRFTATEEQTELNHLNAYSKVGLQVFSNDKKFMTLGTNVGIAPALKAKIRSPQNC